MDGGLERPRITHVEVVALVDERGGGDALAKWLAKRVTGAVAR